MATPTLVQYSTFGSDNGTGTSSLRWWPLENAVLNGNCAIVVLTCGDNETPTISDDQANVYTVGVNADDAVHGQRLLIAYKNNVNNAPKKIKITGTALLFMNGSFMEFRNLDTSGTPTDGSQTGTGTTANPKPASMTTVADGDLVVSGFMRTDSSAPIVSWTAPSGVLVSADTVDNFAGQYQVQATHGAIQPQITWDSAAYSWVSAQLAFKSAAAGTAATILPRIVGVHHQAIRADYAATTHLFQCPCSHGGDMLYSAYIGLADPQSITDSPSGNTWTPTGATISNAAFVRGFYVKAPTLSAALALTVTVIGASTAPGETMFFYEVIGMDQAAPFDVRGTATGNQTAGTSFAGASVTPLHAGGIVFSTMGVESNTLTDTSPGVFLASTDPVEEFSPWGNDENNGWSFYKNPDLSAVQETWVNNLPVAHWASIADAFKAAAAAGGATLMGQATL